MSVEAEALQVKFPEFNVLTVVGIAQTRNEWLTLQKKLYPSKMRHIDDRFEQDLFRECQAAMWKDYKLKMWTWQKTEHKDRAFEYFIVGLLDSEIERFPTLIKRLKTTVKTVINRQVLISNGRGILPT